MDAAVGGMIDLFGGMILGSLGWFFGRQTAKKNRGLDEVHKHIWQTARSSSWYVTLGAIYLLFSLHLFCIKMSIAMVLGLLLLVQMGSWGIIGGILSNNLSIPEPIHMSRTVIGVIVIITSTLIFTVITIITKNWLFLLLGIPPNIIGLFMVLSQKRVNVD